MTPTVLRLLIVVVAMIVAVAGVLLVRRAVPYTVLEENPEFTCFAYAIVGVVYGVYLAFTVVVWQQFDQAKQNATSEAVHLSEVWRDIQVLPPAVRTPLQDKLLACRRGERASEKAP
jgi:Ca2+/H+ antiporter